MVGTFLFMVTLVVAAGGQAGSAATTSSSEPSNLAPLSAPKKTDTAKAVAVGVHEVVSSPLACRLHGLSLVHPRG